MLQWLNKKYPRDTKAGKLEIIDSIIKGLIATYAETPEPTNINSLLMILTNFSCDKIQDFTEAPRALIFKHVLVEKKNRSQFSRIVVEGDGLILNQRLGLTLIYGEAYVSALPCLTGSITVRLKGLWKFHLKIYKMK